MSRTEPITEREAKLSNKGSLLWEAQHGDPVAKDELARRNKPEPGTVDQAQD